MKLSLCNIGRIIEAEFVLDGITVLIGNNNAGKTTVGKVLYAVLSPLEEGQLCREARMDELANQEQRLKKSLNRWLHGQVTRFGVVEGIIRLQTDEGNEYILEVSGDAVKLSKTIRMNRHIHYLVSPFLYDEVNAMRGQVTQERICNVMTPEPSKKRASHKFSPTSMRVAKNENVGDMENVLNMMEEAMHGRAEVISKEGFKFRDNDSSAYINAGNVSAGVKALAFLEYAVRTGAVAKNDILVFDDPEINLHPKWQVIYARALVMLQKQMDLRVIITTHSPYLIRALECLSYTNATMDKLNIYLFELGGDNHPRIRNVSEQEEGLPNLYEQLSHPLDELDTEINIFSR